MAWWEPLALAFLVLVVLQLAGYILYHVNYAVTSLLRLLCYDIWTYIWQLIWVFITTVSYYVTGLMVVVKYFVVIIFFIDLVKRYQLIQMIRNNLYANKVKDEDVDVVGSLCIVCHNNIVNSRKVMLMPCRYFLCLKCKRDLLPMLWHICPLCRAHVRDSIEVPIYIYI